MHQHTSYPSGQRMLEALPRRTLPHAAPVAFIVAWSIGLYVWRSYGDEWMLSLDLLNILCLVPFACVGLLVVVSLGLLALWATNEQHTMPRFLALLLAGSMLALTLPTPLLPAEASFRMYQTDYDLILHLAQQGQLAHSSTCLGTFALPTTLQHISTKCVIVDGAPLETLTIQPNGTPRVVVYAVTDAALHRHPLCSHNGMFTKRLTAHWSICTPT